MLALSSDQSSKFNHNKNTQGLFACSCQLDYQKSSEKIKNLVNNVLNVLKQKATSDINTGVESFVLFTCPETLLLPTCAKLVDELIKTKMLNILCIDEAHICIDFRTPFRRKFLLNLREAVFKN